MEAITADTIEALPLRPFRMKTLKDFARVTGAHGARVAKELWDLSNEDLDEDEFRRRWQATIEALSPEEAGRRRRETASSKMKTVL